MSAINTTIATDFEPWFILVDVLAIIALVSAIVLAIIFLAIVASNRTCQTVSIFLTCNTCMAEIFFGCSMLSIAVFSLENDRKRRIYQDSLCLVRDYLGYVGTALLLYSLTLQAIYRYIIVVYPARLSWQTVSVQGMLACFFWIFSITLLLPWLLTGVATYDVDNQACLLPFQLSIPIIYNVSVVYLIPLCIIILIYTELVRYVRQMDIRTTSSSQTIFQARRELAMVRRIVALISILVIFGLPFTLFMVLSFITTPPRYHYRFSLLFGDLFQGVLMVALFKFSQPVLDVLLKFKRRVSNVDQVYFM